MFQEDSIVTLVKSEAGKAVEATAEKLRVLLETAAFVRETPVERILEAVKDEVIDLTERAFAAVQGIACSEPNQVWFKRTLHVLRPGPCFFPKEDLEQIAAELRCDQTLQNHPELEQLTGTIATFVAKHDALERRMSYLLHPTRHEDVQKLDPWTDSNQIYHYINYEFRAERPLFGILYEIRPAIVPHANMFFVSTGEFGARTVRRLLDTVLLFDNLADWGIDSKRGRAAIDRINEIHGRYNIPNDTFKFVLSNIMFFPILWNARLGWRRFTDVERLGWFYQHVKFAREMHIQGVSEDYDEAKGWWEDLTARAAKPSEMTQKGWENMVVQIVASYPSDLRPWLVQTLIAGLDDLYRQACCYPPTPPEVLESIRRVFFTLGHAGASLPRIPWIRSLHSSALYPYGSRVAELGVPRRGFKLPSIPSHLGPDDSIPVINSNGGFPEGVRPIVKMEDIPEVHVPDLSWEEIRKHTSTDDGWIVLSGFVYDVTAFLAAHPGGLEPLVSHLGKDATRAFEAVGHSAAARILRTNFRIGRVAPAAGSGVEPIAAPAGSDNAPATAAAQAGSVS